MPFKIVQILICKTIFIIDIVGGGGSVYDRTVVLFSAIFQIAVYISQCVYFQDHTHRDYTSLSNLFLPSAKNEAEHGNFVASATRWFFVFCLFPRDGAWLTAKEENQNCNFKLSPELFIRSSQKSGFFFHRRCAVWT